MTRATAVPSGHRPRIDRDGGRNDAGGLQVYAQMGQDHGVKVLWCLALLVLGTFSVVDLGLLTIRGYILFAIVIVVIKLVQVATAH